MGNHKDLYGGLGGYLQKRPMTKQIAYTRTTRGKDKTSDSKYDKMPEYSRQFPEVSKDVPVKKPRLTRDEKLQITNKINYFRTLPKGVREGNSDFTPRKPL